MNKDEIEKMKDEYDFSEGQRGRFSKILKNEKTQITIRLDSKTIVYFKCLAEEKDIPYQNLINLYLRSCVEDSRKLELSWPKAGDSIAAK